MKLTITLLVFAVVTLVAFASETPESGVHNKLQGLAGKDALDCGRAATQAEYAAKSSCAFSAYKRKTPFYVQYSVIGTDAHVEEGIALDRQGTLSHVWTISWSPLYGGKPSGKFTTDLCKAGSLKMLRDNELMCDFPPS
jgi:hypothetical protein